MIKQKNPINTNLESHLLELRHRLFKSLLVILICCIICWFFSSQILHFLRQPIQPFLTHTNGSLIFTAPLDAFLAYLQISIFTGVLIASPFWSYQMWQFIVPGLYKTEKKTFTVFWIIGSALFLVGVIFVYVIILPLVFHVLIPFGNIENQAFITIKHYLSFFTRFALVFGGIFETPLILIALCRMDILSPAILKQYRKHAIVFLAFISALITPPDLLSQIVLLLPLIALYEISIYLTQIFKK